MPKYDIKNNRYLKYSGMALQIAGLCIAAILLGGWLDKYFQNEKKFITAILLILFITGYFYSLYVDLNKPSDQE